MALLLWSGGCDSTLLLHDLLTAHANKDGHAGKYVTLKESEFVRTLAINDPQASGFARMAKARAGLLGLIAKKFGFKHVHGETSVRRKGLFIDTPAFGLPQPVLWLLHASLYLDESEDLYAGYVRCDDFWHLSGWIFQAFNAIQAMTRRTGKLLMPLEWVTKSEVIEQLRAARLLRATWSCEIPKNGRECKKCKPCLAKTAAMFELKNRSK